MKTIKTVKNRPRSEEGFTLIELMIVIVIIGILAAISIIIFGNQQKAAIAATVKNDVASTRALIPSTKTGKMVTPGEDLLPAASITEGNTANYYTNAKHTEACYEVKHSYTETDVVSYYYDTTEGKVKDGSCDAFKTKNTSELVTTIVKELPGGTTPGGSTGETTPTETPTETPTAANKTATCDNAVYTVVGDATITCETISVGWNTTQYKIKVTGTKPTNTKWAVNADFSKVNRYNHFSAWANGTFGNTTYDHQKTKTVTFQGADLRNGSTLDHLDYTTVSTNKTASFTVQIEINRTN